MKKEDIFNKIKEIMDELMEVDSEITYESNLIRDIGMSSIEAMTIVGELESEYGVELPVSEMKDVQSVGDFCDFVLKKVA